MLSVIIGRFQTPYLTRGHKALFKAAMVRESQDVLVLIGTTSAIGTDKNPLCFESRKMMIRKQYGNYFRIKALPDCLSDEDWSNQIDALIGDGAATIFGGRDHSLDVYSGKHQIKIIDCIDSLSATEERQSINCLDSEDFRAGMIYQSMKRYPIVYSTVDVALWRHMGRTEIMMGKKGDKFCFIGGFVDPQDENLLLAAMRETWEETGFEILPYNFTYQFSKKVEDERYRGTKDSIMTHFFSAICNHLPDPSKIQDKEFKEFAWIPAAEASLDLISDAHRPLFLKFINSKN